MFVVVHFCWDKKLESLQVSLRCNLQKIFKIQSNIEKSSWISYYCTRCGVRDLVISAVVNLNWKKKNHWQWNIFRVLTIFIMNEYPLRKLLRYFKANRNKISTIMQLGQSPQHRFIIIYSSFIFSTLNNCSSVLTLYLCPCARPFEFQTFETPILHAPSAGHLAFRIQNIYKTECH